MGLVPEDGILPIAQGCRLRVAMTQHGTQAENLTTRRFFLHYRRDSVPIVVQSFDLIEIFLLARKLHGLMVRFS